MSENHDTATDFILRMFQQAEEDVELRSFADRGGKGPAKSCFGRDLEAFDKFLTKWDEPGRGMYFGVATRAAGARKGDAGHCVEIPAIWCDVDTYHIRRTKEEAVTALKDFALPQTIIIDSGGGIQAFWMLTEPASVADDGEAAKRAMRAAVRVFAGDEKVVDLARVMRLPGTVNSKHGDVRVATVLEDTGREYELCDLIEALEVSPVKLAPQGERVTDALSNAYEAFGRDVDGERVSVNDRLDQIEPGKIHDSQVRIAAQLVSKGLDDEHIVTLLMAKTREAIGHKADEWDWNLEEDHIRVAIKGAHNKGFAPEAKAEARKEVAAANIKRHSDAHKYEDDYCLADIPDDRDGALDYLSARFFQLNFNGTVRICRHVRTESVAGIQRYRLEAFQTRDFADLTNKPVTITMKPDGQKVSKPAGKLWLESGTRPIFMGAGLYPKGNPLAGVLNLWRGWGVEPREGDFSIIDRHIREVICGGDEACYRFVVAWLADAVQNPEKNAETAIVMRGGQGSGKGTFARAIGRIFGQHYLHVTQSNQLVGQFNDHLRDAVLLFADETFFAGARQHEGVLKGLITEPTIAVERKFLPVEMVPNRLHILMASNSDWVVPAGVDDRRFLVLDVSNTVAGDPAYFDSLNAAISGDELGAFLQHLLALDLSAYCAEHGVNLRRPPKTAALLDQKIASLEPHAAWWLETLQSGSINDWLGSYAGADEDELLRPWPSKLATARAHSLFVDWGRSRGIRHIKSQTALTQFLTGLGYEDTRARDVPINERRSSDFGTSYAIIRKRQARVIALPSLPEARGAFEAYVGQSINWGDEDPEDGKVISFRRDDQADAAQGDDERLSRTRF